MKWEENHLMVQGLMLKKIKLNFILYFVEPQFNLKIQEYLDFLLVYFWDLISGIRT